MSKRNEWSTLETNLLQYAAKQLRDESKIADITKKFNELLKEMDLPARNYKQVEGKLRRLREKGLLSIKPIIIDNGLKLEPILIPDEAETDNEEPDWEPILIPEDLEPKKPSYDLSKVSFFELINMFADFD